MCPSGVGLDCRNTIDNPCTAENIEMDLVYWTLPGSDTNYLHCTSEGLWSVHKCADGLFWNQEERTCTVNRPLPITGVCQTYPCKNAAHCLDLGSNNFKCVCKEGYTGDFCEDLIDSCSSNPCMNGGRCLSYPGGYTCVCPDKIIDECCCNGK